VPHRRGLDEVKLKSWLQSKSDRHYSQSCPGEDCRARAAQLPACPKGVECPQFWGWRDQDGNQIPYDPAAAPAAPGRKAQYDAAVTRWVFGRGMKSDRHFSQLCVRGSDCASNAGLADCPLGRQCPSYGSWAAGTRPGHEPTSHDPCSTTPK
jgi:hypothetical protein